MPSKSYFSYVRVSTQRQGQHGTSLAEQTDAIDRYAARWNLHISKRYEERETAAKTGRPVFLEMLKAIKKGKAQGLIVHKIDRSARNLKDWAELGSCIDLGVEVHFANESLDMTSRGGRLSADIQAVVAADFIRNLREETKKGIYGRIRQGLYPFPAVTGYRNVGKGKPKEIDPIQGPLVKRAFELYATGNMGLNALVEEMFALGLRNRSGTKVSRNGIVKFLRNPFYIGLIRIQSTGETFAGQHKPIISHSLFEAVQEVLDGKSVKKTTRHFFLFRKHIICGTCRGILIPERQKGHAYYRCHRRACPQKTIREELVEKELLQTLKRLRLSNCELDYFKNQISSFQELEPQRITALRVQAIMQSEQISTRLNRLADAYMEGVFDKETYLERKNSLVREQGEIRERLNSIEKDVGEMGNKLNEFLELLKSAYLSYKLANEYERRELVKTITSNFTVEGESVVIKPNIPFDLVLDRQITIAGSPRLAASRTLPPLLQKLFRYFELRSKSKDTEHL